jgi:hypothetical protein
MAAKKTTTKKTTTKLVAPREVWLIIDDGDPARRPLAYRTKSAADTDRVLDDSERVVGPYVLAERRRER